VDEACGGAWQTAVHPEDLPELLDRWRSIPVSGEPPEVKARVRRFDGEYRWFAFRMRPFGDPSGQLVKWCGIGSDIEDQKRAENALRESDRRLRLIFDGLPTHVGLSNADCEIEHVNRNYEEYFGAPLAELKRQGRYHNCHPDDRPRALAAQNEAIETGRPYEIEVRRRGADGIYRWFQVRHFPLRDSDGRIVLWYLLQTDIDDRKKAETLLAGEMRLLEMVAAGFAFRRPRRVVPACRRLDRRLLLQRRVGRSNRHTSRTRSRTEPSKQLRLVNNWSPRECRLGPLRDGGVPQRASCFRRLNVGNAMGGIRVVSDGNGARNSGVLLDAVRVDGR
jgi:PAS domain S-box-containing protein